MRFKQEPMYGLSAEKVAIVERWPLVEVIECISPASQISCQFSIVCKAEMNF